MGNRNLIIIAFAVVLGLFAVILANSYFSGVEEQQERVAQQQQLTRLVVATQPLEFGAPLTRENLRLANFPADAVPQGAFTTIDQALQGGRVALRPIVPGEPVLADKVSGTGGRAVLAANLPEGMRAVSVPISAVTGVAGFVRPGDTVDVILTRQIPGDGADGQDLMSDVILQRVPVLATDQVASEKETAPQVGSTVTLQVDLYAAQKLTIATRIGTLSLALRNVENATPAPLTTVTARDLGGSGIRIRGRNANAAAIASAASAIPQQVVIQAPGFAPAAGGGPAIMPRMGPSMTIFRGTESTSYPVDRLRGL